MTSLPESLTRFRSDLEEAISREQASRRSRRMRRVTVGASLATASVAVALGLLSALPGGGPSIVDRAAAALERRADTIRHTKIVYRRVYRDGTVSWSAVESWEQGRRPFAIRATSIASDGRRVIRKGSASSGFSDATFTGSLWDPRTNTIYVRPPRGPAYLRPAPRYCAVEGVATRRQLATCAYPFFAPGPRAGTYRVTSLRRLNDTRPFRYQVESRIVTEKTARRISDSFATKGPIPEYHRQRILELLQRDDVTVSGRARVDGRDAIRLVWNAGRSVYLVDASTYDPIWLRETDGRGTQTTRFLIYETLPLNARTRPLLSLQAQHPTARISSDPKEYKAAALRLSFHG